MMMMNKKERLTRVIKWLQNMHNGKERKKVGDQNFKSASIHEMAFATFLDRLVPEIVNFVTDVVVVKRLAILSPSSDAF